MRNSIKLNLNKKRNLAGFIFTLPFTLGFIFFFLVPFVQSFIFSVSELHMTREGWYRSFQGLENYRFALVVHESYLRILIETMLQMMGNVFFIVVFSFIIAVILKAEFRGRVMARAIFFLPVILGAGIILRLEQGDYLMQTLEYGVESLGMVEEESFLGGEALRNILIYIQMPDFFLRNIMAAIERVPDIVNSSGIQILIFLAGLQAIPPSVYEAADVEGATGWEAFWLITLPMMSPHILTNVIYTVIDFFTAVDNPIIELVHSTAIGGGHYGRGVAMAWLYFAMIALILLIFSWVISRWIFYYE